MTFTDYSETRELLPLPPPWLPAIQALVSTAPWILVVEKEDDLSWLDDAYELESAYSECT